MDRSLELRLIGWNYNPIPRSTLDLEGVPPARRVSLNEVVNILKKTYEEAPPDRYRLHQDGNMILFDGSETFNGWVTIAVETPDMSSRMEYPTLAMTYGGYGHRLWSGFAPGLFIFSPQDNTYDDWGGLDEGVNGLLVENHDYYVDDRYYGSRFARPLTLVIGKKEGLIHREFRPHAILELPTDDKVRVSVLPIIDNSQRDRLLERLKTMP